MNCLITEGITTALSQSSLTRTWWEDAATHWLHAKIRLPSSATAPLPPFELFYGCKPLLSLVRLFGCLAYVHLQKDQRPLLTSHAVQCVLIGYPTDYKAWEFWNPSSHQEVILDSAVFRKSVFPHRRPGLLGDVRLVDLSPPASLPISQPAPERPIIPFHPALGDDPLILKALPAPAPELPPKPSEPSTGDQSVSQLVAHFHAPCPALPPSSASDPPVEHPCTPPAVNHLTPPVECPRTPPAVKRSTSHFKHHPSVAPLPPKRASKAHQPGVFAKANLSVPAEGVEIPIHDAVEYALRTSGAIEPRTLAEALRQPDAGKWVAATLAEIKAHMQNGTWVLAQLLPGKRAIGSRWIFKVKRTPEGLINKYKGWIVAQGYSQIPGVHYNEVFASM
jgi:hypothetical protein